MAGPFQLVVNYYSLIFRYCYTTFFNFKDIPSDVKSKLMDIYCLDL